MGTSIQLPPELEKRVRESAEAAGLDFNQYIVEVLEGKRPYPVLLTGKDRETELLQKVYLKFPDSFWKRFRYLKFLLEEQRIDSEEQKELIDLSDRLEEVNAERFKYLIELS